MVRSITVNSTGPTGPSKILALDNPLSVRQLVRLQAGDLDMDGQALTLLSVRGGGTALIDNTGGIVTGSGTSSMQRAVDISTPDGIGYHQLSSPVTSTTVDDLSAPYYVLGTDFILNPAYNAAVRATQTRPFPSLMGYDETRIATSPATDLGAFDKGYFSPTTGDTWTPGRGYTANMPNGALPDFVGTFNNGPITISGLTRGSDAQAGYHLLGNPYASPLKAGTIGAGQLTNLDANIYVFHATSRYSGYYTNYLSTVATGVGNTTAPNGDTPSSLIDAGSAFFMHVTTPNTSNGALALTNTNRLTTFTDPILGSQTAFGRNTAGNGPLLTLQVNGANTVDLLTVHTNTNATTGLDSRYDAVKLSNPTGLNLAAVAANTQLAINGLPAFTATTVVPLMLGVPANGNYTFTVPTMTNFGSTRAYLRDTQTGTERLLAAGNTYAFTIANAAAGRTPRFSLVFRPSGALATTAALTAAQVNVYPNPAHGTFSVLLPPVAGQSAVQATLLNALGQVATARTIALTAAGATAEFSTAALAQGVYVLRLQAGAETFTQRVVVE